MGPEGEGKRGSGAFAEGVRQTGEVNDRLFLEPRLCELYDLYHPWERRAELSFYLPLLMSAETVLDVGCGTGELLRLARQAGHSGRLSGVDPANAMLQQARKRPDIEWVLGAAASGAGDRQSCGFRTQWC